MTTKAFLGPSFSPEPIVACELPVPCGGTLLLGSWHDRLVVSDWVGGWHHERIMNRVFRHTHARLTYGTTPVIEQAIAWLNDYFSGSRDAHAIALHFFGTPFQLRIWNALKRIPYGKTITYGELAASVGCPLGARAAGVATGENPFSIIVPCHRVVGKDTSLTGYGGGYAAKKFLLALESGVSLNELAFKNSVHPKGRI